jgi:hypothetical protein
MGSPTHPTACETVVLCRLRSEVAQGALRNTRAGECRLVAYGRVGHELPDLLSTAAGDGGLGSPLQRLLA